ncbi:MAG: Ribbon-helix-helix domain [Phycisphaerales bacterium]|nr:Ribbon-helix-helix domain [Phycisphaerales bacterium]
MLSVAARRSNKSPLSVRINTQLLQRLERHSLRVGRSRSEVVDRAIEEYLDRHDQQASDHKPHTRK